MLTQSPKVVVTEIDLSNSIEAASELSVALVGQARRGKAFEKVLVSNDRQFIDVFGNPKPGFYLPYAALNYFQFGKTAWCTRVVSEDAKCATLMADASGEVTNIPGIKNPQTVQSVSEEVVYTTTSAANVYSIDLSDLYTYFTPGSIRLEIAGSQSISFVDDASGEIESGNNTLWMNYLDGTLIVECETELEIGDTFELSATYSDFNHFDEYLAGKRQTAFVGDASTGPYAFAFETEVVENSVNIYDGTGTIVGTDDGAGNITGTGIAAGTIDYALGTGSITTSAAVTSGAAVIGSYSYQRLAGTLIHSAITGPGSYGTTEFTLNICNITDYPSSGFYFNDSPRADGSNRCEFLIILKDMLTSQMVENYVASRDPVAKNLDGTSRFANDLFATPHHLYTVVKETDLTTEVGSFKDGNDLKYVYFVGGENGDLPILDADYVRGFNLYQDKQEISIAIIPSLGASLSVQNRIIAICEARGSTALLDTPLTADSSQEVVDIRRGVTTPSFNPNSSYAGLYGGWRQIKDWINDKTVWVPFTASVLANFARVFYYEEPWDAVFGSRKGVLTETEALLFNPQEGERDYMYANQVNPIFSSPGKGTRIMGQKTTQAAYSALSFLNTRFLLNILEAAIADYAEFALSERNNDTIRNKMRIDIESYLDFIRRRGGVDRFKVICDRTNNTDYILDQRGLVVDIYIVPTSDVETVQLNAIIMNHSTSFDEIIVKS